MARTAHAEQEPVSYNGYVIESNIPITAQKRGSGPRAAKYPFDMLDVGQSFHVPATETMPNPSITLAGAVTNANEKWSHPDPSGQTETKMISQFAVGEDGKRIKGADGKYVKVGAAPVTSVKKVYERHFTIRTADATDHMGPGARVWRDI